MALYCRYLLIVLLLGSLLSCGPNYVFQKEYNFGPAGWAYKDSLVFSVPIADTLSIYNLYLDVGHSDEYAYQNMYVRIHTTFPDAQRLTERLSIDLAAKSGQWKGACSGKNCQLRVNIREGAFFNQAGNYTFTVEQFMRHDTLAAIKSIGFSIEDTGERRGGNTPK